MLTLVDNYVDLLLPDTPIVTRPPRAPGNRIPSDTLLAEHGLSLLVRVDSGEQSRTILFDAGYTRIALPHNARHLGVRWEEVTAVVLSHGHMDHTGSLETVLQGRSGPLPLILHPAAFHAPRYLVTRNGRKLEFPRTLRRGRLRAMGFTLQESSGPTLLAGGRILASGEVQRSTEFEKGLPNALVENGGRLEPDPLADDQAVAIRLKDKGLVVICGCSHSGIINTLIHARRISGEERVHAVLGGLHLSGPDFEAAIPPTIEALRRLNPAVLAPMHCTGWQAGQQLAAAFPEAFVRNSVGSRIHLTA